MSILSSASRLAAVARHGVAILAGSVAALAQPTALSSGGQYGETVGWSADRGQIMYWLPADTRQYLDQWTRTEILRKVEWLFQTFGIVKEGIRGIARHATGDGGIALQLNSDDEEWNELAEADFEQYAMSAARCDIAGRRNFYEAQEHAIEQRLKAGEFFASHASNPRWSDEPCFQLWDSREIESPGDTSTLGMTVIDGIGVDQHTTPLVYFARALDGTHQAIPAGEMIHWYKADGTNQVRGVSELAQAVNNFVDIKELIQITTKTAKQNTALGLHIKKMVKAGGQGALAKLQTLYGSPGAEIPGDTQAPPQYERLVGGGAVIYTDQDGDAKLLTPNSPTPLLEPFITKVLMRNALSSLGPPSEFFWALEDLNGVAQRVVLIKADAVFRKLSSDCAARFCSPVATRYILDRIATGKLRKCKDPNWLLKMEWGLPGRLSVDNGRDAAAEINQLSNGIETLRGINDRRGRGWRKQIRQWFLEFKFAKSVAEQLEVPWALKYWRANLPGAGAPAPGDASNPDAPDSEDPPDPADKPKSKKKPAPVA